MFVKSIKPAMKDEMKIHSSTSGVWCTDNRGNRSGIEWDEIYAVSGGKVDLITSEIISIDIDYEDGEFLTLNSDFLGFDEVIPAITEHLPGISPLWLSKIKELEIGQTLVVWRRNAFSEASVT